jgi:hypothetical protein
MKHTGCPKKRRQNPQHNDPVILEEIAISNSPGAGCLSSAALAKTLVSENVISKLEQCDINYFLGYIDKISASEDGVSNLF